MNMKSKKIQNTIFTFLLIFILSLVSCSQSTNENIISLKGEWQFQTDPEDVGIKQNWFNTKLNDVVNLPGSMRDNNKGDEVTLSTKWTGSIYDSSWYFRPDMAKYRQKDNLKFPFWLTPNKHYVGVAWYQRKVKIPVDWKERRTELFLERPHWETTVWIDSTKIGMQNSLSTPHLYDLTKALTPGSHIISIRIDNRIKEINVGPDSHSITDQTQGNWNGIVGDIYLKSISPVSFNDIKLYTNIKEKSVTAKIIIDNILEKDVSAKIELRTKSFNSNEEQNLDALVKEVNASKGKSSNRNNLSHGRRRSIVG